MKYVGLTIGPIYKTLQKADQAREIWAGSFLFAYLIRNILHEMIHKKKYKPEHFILPNVDELVSIQDIDNIPKYGIGLYPDRIILKQQNELEDIFGDLECVIDEVLKKFASEILSRIKTYYRNLPINSTDSIRLQDYVKKLQKDLNNWQHSNVLGYLGKYLQFYFLEIDEKELNLKNNWTHIHQINYLLSNLELRSSIAWNNPDFLKIFIYSINNSFLIKNAFYSRTRFDTLIEISTREIRFINQDLKEIYDNLVKDILGEKKYQNQDDDEFFLESLQNNSLIRENSLFRSYHKYVAIIHADGDNMGKLIGALGNEPEKVRGFSAKLIEFAKKANQIIAGDRNTNKNGESEDWGFGGTPIYIGGDELVIFAPVVSRDKNGKLKTIFKLVEELDNAFDTIFNQYDEYKKIFKDSDSQPCMSYGITITYYKYPMKEAIKESHDLMEQVKNDKYKTRNRLNFKIIKHSGQYFGGIIDKNQRSDNVEYEKKSYDYFLELTSNKLNKFNNEASKNEQFINSIAHKLDLLKPIFGKVAQDSKLLQNFFDNHFDEPIHNENRDYLNLIRDYIYVSFKDYKKTEQEQVLNNIYGTLRFIHFINSNANE